MRKRLECQRRPYGCRDYAGQYNMFSYPWLHGMDQRAWMPDGGTGMWMPGTEEDREEKKDLEYWNQLYPAQTRRIQREVERQCDRIDYEGSVMYDEYPDRIALARICEAVYQALMQEETGNIMEEYPSGMPGTMPGTMPGNMSGDGSAMGMNTDNDIMPEEEDDDEAYDFRSDSGLEMLQYDRRGGDDRRDGRDRADRSLQDLIEVLLFNEIHRRRRRRRRSRSWYFG